MSRMCRRTKSLTHRIRPTALGTTTVVIIPVAAESNPCPIQTRRVSEEDVTALADIVDDICIWDIIVRVDVSLEAKSSDANSWGKRAIVEGETGFMIE